MRRLECFKYWISGKASFGYLDYDREDIYGFFFEEDIFAYMSKNLNSFQ